MAEDPIRLQQGNTSPLVRSLIVAGRTEQPRAALVRQTLLAMGVTAQHAATLSVASSASIKAGAAAPAAVGTASTTTLSSAAGISLPILAAKWVSIGLVGGALAVSAASNVGRPRTPNHRVEVPAYPKSAGVVRSAPDLASNETRPEQPPATTTARPSRPVSVTLATPSAAVDHGSQLAAEIAVLDRARQAVSTGNGAQARQLLRKYEIEFPKARMLPEAWFLRLEAATLEGDSVAASAAAQEIVRSYPASPHVARARKVLGFD